MKLRIKGNSIRLRLTKTEVSEFSQNRSITEAIEFTHGEPLLYRLSMSDDTDPLTKHTQNLIEVRIPTAIATNWALTDTVSIEHWAEVGQKKLRILIEKDFACLQSREHEDDSDAYENPNTNC